MKYLSWRRLSASLVVAFAGTSFAQTPQTPTSESLNATAGPYSVATESVSPFSARGFGGGTIYYPTTSARYGVVAICPGFTATQSSVAWLGRRMASHGLVVITMDTISTLDQPSSRATQLMAALKHVVESSSSTVRGRVDGQRRAVSGHSMGGGGALIAARDNPTLKGSVPLTPWNTSSNFSGVSVPTMIFGADGDTIAPVAFYSRPFYASLPTGTLKAYAELNGASHLTPNSTNTPIGRYSVTWVKRFVDNDTRYSPFLCGADHEAYATPAIFDRYQQNCPY